MCVVIYILGQLPPKVSLIFQITNCSQIAMCRFTVKDLSMKVAVHMQYQRLMSFNIIVWKIAESTMYLWQIQQVELVQFTIAYCTYLYPMYILNGTKFYRFTI